MAEENKLKPASAMYGGYGSYELKSKYQRNMMFGTLFSTGLVVLIILTAYIYKLATEVDTFYVQQTVIRTIADLGPPPTV